MKLYLSTILTFLALLNGVISKQNRENRKSKVAKDTIATGEQAVTFFVMGNASDDDPGSDSENDHELSENSSANSKTRHGHNAKTPFAIGPTKKHQVPGYRKHNKKHRTTAVHAASRQSITNSLGSIGDVQSAYRHGVDADVQDSMDRVKSIDDGTLTDYFHAINGDDSKQQYARPSTRLNSYEEPEEEDANVDPQQAAAQTAHYKEPEDDNTNADSQQPVAQTAQFKDSPGLEVYSDNPEEATDDFYSAIHSGKKPPPPLISMKVIRPTKSHFGNSKQFVEPANDEESHDRLTYTANEAQSISGPGDVEKETEQDIAESNGKMAGGNGGMLVDGKGNGKEESGASKVAVTQEAVASAPSNEPTKEKDEKPTPAKSVEEPTPQQDSQPDKPAKAINTQEAININPLPQSQVQNKNKADAFASMGNTFLSNPFFNPKFFNLFGFNKQRKDDSKENNETSDTRSKSESKEPDSLPPNFKGTKIIGGKITGGKISGGYIQGGRIIAGDIEGGVIKGGQVEGGKFLNGTMEGGLLHDGVIEGGRFVNGTFDGGIMKGGNVYGGKIKGGSIEGGDMQGGLLLGGRFHGGSLEGGVVKGGYVDGGRIKGGNIEGGIMSGGSVEGGSLKEGRLSGGILKAGSMTGGEMTSGSIEGGILRGGRISGGILKGGTMEAGELKGGVVLAGHINGGIIEGGVIEGGEIGEGVIIKSGHINGTIVAVNPTKHKQQNEGHTPNVVIHAPKQVEMAGKQGETTNNRDAPKDQQAPLLMHDGNALDAHDNKAFTADHDGKHHIVFDGVSFDVPDDGFSDLVRKMNGEQKDLGRLLQMPGNDSNDNKEHAQESDKHDNQANTGVTQPDKPDKPVETNTKTSNSTNGRQDDKEIKPEDIINKLSRPTPPRSVVTDPKLEHVHDVTANRLTSAQLKPSYHWSLSKLMEDRIPGSPGAAMITHGQVKSTRGGLAFNGNDAWLGGGDYAGGCISAPDKCDDGFAFEMTLKMDKESINGNDMRYIVDSGASTFNSKGFSLYTLHGKLRADIAIPDDSLCLEAPIEPERWHDVLVTWKKDQGLRMYMNCELIAETKSNEHCLGCRSAGCHVTDYNTKLMIGRPNYSPHFHCTKFESGDISFWEQYLSPEDVNNICGRGAAPAQALNDKEPSEPSSDKGNSTQESEQKEATSDKEKPSLPSRPEQATPQQQFQQATPQQQQQVGGNVPMTSQPYAQAQQPAMGMVPQASQPQGNMYPQMAQPQRNAPFVGQQTMSRPNAKGEYEISFPSTMQIGKSYEFDQFIPAMGRQPAPQTYTNYQQARAPSYPSPMMYPAMYAPRQASFARGGKRNGLKSSGVEAKYFTAWNSWSACSKSCGYGVRARKRTCLNPQILLPGGRVCSGPSIQHGFCYQAACSVNGRYSNWSPWGSCDRSCGRGAQVRTRICNNPAPRFGGKSCHVYGSSVQVRRCNRQPCPVNGRFSEWSKFSPCTKTCGIKGIRFRLRTCTNPPPAFGGRPCSGPAHDSRPCGLSNPCPVKGGYGSWTPWTTCDADCGGGMRERMRFCNNPEPRWGGRGCKGLGPSHVTELCNLSPCDVSETKKRMRITSQKKSLDKLSKYVNQL